MSEMGTQLNSLKVPDEVENCSICLEDIEDASNPENCSHIFCFKCIVNWAKVKGECPLCKKQFYRVKHKIGLKEELVSVEVETRNSVATNESELFDEFHESFFRLTDAFVRVLERNEREEDESSLSSIETLPRYSTPAISPPFPGVHADGPSSSYRSTLSENLPLPVLLEEYYSMDSESNSPESSSIILDNEPTSPRYEPTSPSYDPASPQYSFPSPGYEPSSPERYESPSPEDYEPASPERYEPLTLEDYEPASSELCQPLVTMPPLCRPLLYIPSLSRPLLPMPRIILPFTPLPSFSLPGNMPCYSPNLSKYGPITRDYDPTSPEYVPTAPEGYQPSLSQPPWCLPHPVSVPSSYDSPHLLHNPFPTPENEPRDSDVRILETVNNGSNDSGNRGLEFSGVSHSNFDESHVYCGKRKRPASSDFPPHKQHSQSKFSGAGSSKDLRNLHNSAFDLYDPDISCPSPSQIRRYNHTLPVANTTSVPHTTYFNSSPVRPWSSTSMNACNYLSSNFASEDRLPNALLQSCGNLNCDNVDLSVSDRGWFVKDDYLNNTCTLRLKDKYRTDPCLQLLFRNEVYSRQQKAINNINVVKVKTKQHFLEHHEDLSRVYPWLHRELQVLMKDNKPKLSQAFNRLFMLLRCLNIDHWSFREEAQDFVGENHVALFQHELLCFCISGLTMREYDETVIYDKEDVPTSTASTSEGIPESDRNLPGTSQGRSVNEYAPSSSKIKNVPSESFTLNHFHSLHDTPTTRDYLNVPTESVTLETVNSIETTKLLSKQSIEGTSNFGENATVENGASSSKSTSATAASSPASEMVNEQRILNELKELSRKNDIILEHLRQANRTTDNKSFVEQMLKLHKIL